MEIRDAVGSDHDRIDQLHLDAFGEHGRLVGRLVRALRDLAASRRGLELVAEEDGAVVGHAMWSAGWLDAPRGLVDVQVLSPLAVASTRQRTGVGRALVTAGGVRLAALAVPADVLEGDPDYYSRLGFVRALDLGILRPSSRIPEPAFQTRTLPAWEPWMTGTVVYPDPFWALDAVGPR